MNEQTSREEIQFYLQTGAGRIIKQTFKNPLPESQSETMISKIGTLNQSLAGGLNNMWYEDPRLNIAGADYTNDNKIIKIIKADLYESTKTVTDNVTQTIERITTIYNETN